MFWQNKTDKPYFIDGFLLLLMHLSVQLPLSKSHCALVGFGVIFNSISGIFHIASKVVDSF
ncbi:MAG: hypothetical protein EAZ32_01360 [Cytophagia bacterium]|nr:MAG: hypothetical protein EAZ46_12810 [Runella sp.]TAG15859.1 MAG: hypothetical protein EAZ38_19265 [Cytophagales bacterium]TAG42138.1 MAG: hypothetical protein EAZ32_01360 [Cytophagia bacterium]TAG55803.1 MAG: hypothetical protein EAZ29_03545 [Runella slithyformis]TAG76250.1 MAG: hypothetical protein EAZ22_18630 [Cytophagales bacterium]